MRTLVTTLMACILIAAVAAMAQEGAPVSVTALTTALAFADLQSNTTRGVTTYEDFVGRYGQSWRRTRINPVKILNVYRYAFTLSAKTKDGGVTASFVNRDTGELTNEVLRTIGAWTNQVKRDIAIEIR